MRCAAPGFGATAILLLFAAPVFAQTESALRPEVTRIDAPEEFGSPQSIRVGPAGEVHVVFSERPFVRRWVTATEEWRIVPLTDAPESFVPARLGWSGDRLWAIDRRQTALWLESDRGSRASFRDLYLPRPNAGPRSARVLAVDGAGRLLVETSATLNSMAAADPRSAAVFAELPPGVTLPRPVDSLPVWVVQADGVIADTVAMLSTANRVLVLPLSVRVDASGTARVERLMRVQPLPDHPLVAAGPTGFVVVVERPAEQGDAPAAYLLRVFEPDWQAAAVHSLSYVPVPVRSGWADSTIATLAADLVERGEGVATATDVASRMLYQPDHLPAISAAFIGPEGWIWIQRYGFTDEGEREWEIVDPTGERVGVVSLDSRFDVTALHRRTAWATMSEGPEPHSIWLIDAR